MYETLASLAEEAIVEACWSQWSTLVGEATSAGEARTIDPGRSSWRRSACASVGSRTASLGGPSGVRNF